MEETKELKVIENENANNVLTLAVQKNYDIEDIRKMMDLQERYEKREAEKAFHKALAKFKANPPKIWRDLQVKYDVGNKITQWSHADLGKAGEAIGQGLGEHGLNHTWRTEQLKSKEIKVTCVVSHELGHSESTFLIAPPDTSGSKNSIQAIGSTIFYLERYTLFAMTGLAPARMDDDGQNSKQEDFISDEQVSELSKLIKESNTMEGAFLKSYKVETLSEFTVSMYESAKKTLNARKKK